MQNTRTHRVTFKRRDLEPVLITAEQADRLIKYRSGRDYDPKMIVTVGPIQSEAGGIELIEELKAPQVRHGQRNCENAQCSSQSRVHREDEHCEYDITAECEDCQKELFERDRSYSLAKFKHVWCRQCSPFGRAAELCPGTDRQTRFLQGLIVGCLQKGMTEEQAVERANQIMTRKGMMFT